MALINWDDSLSVNVAEIDSQHQQLVKIINELHDAMLEGKDKETLSNVLLELSNYVETHFATEEEYFEKYGYEGTSSHIFEHNNFIDKVLEFKRDFDEGKTTLSDDVMHFLKKWLVNHIEGSDKRYTQCFNDHGLK
ncbi:MAG: bacteriohemerythrin [Gemmatimonadota bacterium]|nr:bacteriohemerythrin [Gemmatimonadota bacterium]